MLAEEIVMDMMLRLWKTNGDINIPAGFRPNILRSLKNAIGYQDGTLAQARFNAISDIAIGSAGSIYLLDTQNKAIRKVFLQ